MGTRLDNQILPNSRIHQARESPSGDVWTTMSDVIGDWGLGEKDLWQRLLDRHEEVLKTGAVNAFLFQQFNFGAPCSCTKDETKQVNQRCPECWGVQFVGGYEKLGFTTINIASSASSVGGEFSHDGNTGGTVGDAPTFTNSVLKHKGTDQIELIEGQVSGVITSPVFQITRSLKFDSFRLDATDGGPRKFTTDNFKIEYTVDGGLNYFDLKQDTTLLDSDSFTLQIRITMTRPTAADHTPVFNIFRIRFQTEAQPLVKISKKSFPEARVLESFGVRVTMDNMTWWTTPSMGRFDGKEHFIQENDVFEIVSGRYKAEPPSVEEYPDSGRFKPSNVLYVEPLGRFLSQRFNMRPLQPDEPEAKIY